MIIRGFGILLVKPRARVQLQRNACERLLERVVQLLRQACAFSKDAFELQFGFLSCRNLNLQLLGAFYARPRTSSWS